MNGFEGLYRISNKGRVYSIRRDIMLKPKLNKYGYYEVNLWKDKNHHKTIHRLVALHFVKGKEGCNIVNHLDSNKLNNDANNLEWTTVKGNTQHAYWNNKEFYDRVQRNWRQGTKKKKLKINAFLNGELIGRFESKKEAAEKLNISPKTIYNRLHNRFRSKTGYTFEIREVGL